MLKKYLSAAEILELAIERYTSRSKLIVRATLEEWIFRYAEIEGSDKPIKEYHINNFPISVREEGIHKLIAKNRANTTLGNLSAIEKVERMAYARFEIIQHILTTGITKEQFVVDYNCKRVAIGTYDLINEVSCRTLYRWISDYQEYGIEGLKGKEISRRAGKIKNSEIKELVEGTLL
ncbi:hypothetical protein ABSA28_01142 [Candidatus Hepatincolaceae symbiont of Richtersius coronifer]